MPQISVIIPAYNAARFLAATLDSLRAQSFTDWECLIVNDGSSDDTFPIAQRYAALDPRIHAFSQPNAGVSTARNNGFHHSTPDSPFVVFHDADDLYTPDALQTLFAALTNDPAAAAAHALAEYIDDQNRIVNPGTLPDTGRARAMVNNNRIVPVPPALPTTFAVLALESRIFPPGLLLIRRQHLTKIGLFNPAFRISEDLDLYLRLASTGHFVFINEPLLHYRRHANNASNVKNIDRVYWTVRRSVYHSGLLSPEQQALLIEGTILYQRRKARMWRIVAVGELSKAQFRNAFSCWARMLVNYYRYFRIRFTKSQLV